MSKQNKQIEDYLLAKWFSGNTSKEELRSIEEWRGESEENENFLRDSERVKSNLQQLSIMEGCDSETAIQKVKTRIRKNESSKLRFTYYWQRIASIIVIPLLLYSIYQYTDLDLFNWNSQLSWNEVSTPSGVRHSVTMPDGSIILLNGNTSLRYPSDFDGNERIVELKGEAFFQVRGNKKKPFIVEAGKLAVQVVGTSFNVFSRPEDTSLETTLVEGRVNLLNVKTRKKITAMKPGQMAVYDSLTNQLVLSNVDMEKQLAWREGKFIFRNDPLKEVLRKLGYHFNMSFEIDKDVRSHYAYTGTFQYENLDQILEYIELTTPIKFVEYEPIKNQDGSYVRQNIKVKMKNN